MGGLPRGSSLGFSTSPSAAEPGVDAAPRRRGAWVTDRSRALFGVTPAAAAIDAIERADAAAGIAAGVLGVVLARRPLPYVAGEIVDPARRVARRKAPRRARPLALRRASGPGPAQL